MNNSPIAILMSAFNGEKYIAGQIRSLFDQTYKEWELYIRDDGSEDATLDIVRDLSGHDSRIHLMADSTPHRGVKESFIWLLSHVPASSYYMFCDQDDIWLPRKIEISYQAMRAAEQPNEPILICTDLHIVDEDLNMVHDSMWKQNRTSRIIGQPENIQIAPLYTGCTMMFNESARKAILNRQPCHHIIHDQLAALTVFKEGGKIIALPDRTILYRQHSNNAIGTYTGKNYLLHRLKNIKAGMQANLSYYKIVHEFLGTSRSKFLILKIKHLLRY